MSRSDGNGAIEIDLAVHFMKTDEEEPDKMNVNYAASKSLIKNPSLE